MTMLIAGHETTAAVLTWTMFLLAQHPEVVERIRAEVSSHNGLRQLKGFCSQAQCVVATRTLCADAVADQLMHLLLQRLLA